MQHYLIEVTIHDTGYPDQRRVQQALEAALDHSTAREALDEALFSALHDEYVGRNHEEGESPKRDESTRQDAVRGESCPSIGRLRLIASPPDRDKTSTLCDLELLHQHGLAPGEKQARDETAPATGNESVESLVAWVESRGVESDDLDELVHDCCSATASGINNRGLAEQIRFLVDQLGESGAAAQVTEIANSCERIGQSALEHEEEDTADHVPKIVDPPASEKGSQFRTEAHCLRSPTGRHIPDEDTIHLEPDGGDWYVDVNCVHCGRSGCIAKFDAEGVDW